MRRQVIGAAAGSTKNTLVGLQALEDMKQARLTDRIPTLGLQGSLEMTEGAKLLHPDGHG